MLELTDFRINLHISKIKVKINDVAISKSLWLLKKIF